MGSEAWNLQMWGQSLLPSINSLQLLLRLLYTPSSREVVWARFGTGTLAVLRWPVHILGTWLSPVVLPRHSRVTAWPPSSVRPCPNDARAKSKPTRESGNQSSSRNYFRLENVSP